MKNLKQIFVGVVISSSITFAGDGNCNAFPSYEESAGIGVNMCIGYNDNTILQIIDLSKGASLELLYEKGGKKNGAETVKLKNMSYFWDKMKNKYSDREAISVINGTFFEGKSRFNRSYNINDKRKLAFTIQENKHKISGYTTSNLKVLYVNGTTATIKNFYDLNEEGIIIGGYSIRQNKNNKKIIGRNFIGIKNNILYSLVSKSLTSNKAKKILNYYGIPDKNILVLDGGPSAHLISDSHEIWVEDDVWRGLMGQDLLDRPVAHAIGIRGGGEIDTNNFSIRLRKNKRYKISVNTTRNFQNVFLSQLRSNQNILSWMDSNLKFVSSDFCLNAHNPRQGSNVNLYKCDIYDSEQQWKYNSVTGLVQLKNSDLCLNSYKTKEGSNLNLWGCNSRDRDQIFELK